MFMFNKVFMFTAGLALAISSHADVYLGSYQGYEYYLLPSKTKQVTRTKYEVQMERFVAQDKKVDGLAKGSYTLYRRYIECSNKTVATISWANYNKHNRLLDSKKMSHLKYYDIFPRSWGSALYDEICR